MWKKLFRLESPQNEDERAKELSSIYKPIKIHLETIEVLKKKGQDKKRGRKKARNPLLAHSSASINFL